MSYHAFALIHANSDLDFGVLTERLAERLRHTRVLRVANSIQVYFRGWTATMAFVTDPHVAAESATIAERFVDEDQPNRATIALCNTRLEITGDADPNSERFNDFVGVLDVLSKFDNIVLFDPDKGTFM